MTERISTLLKELDLAPELQTFLDSIAGQTIKSSHGFWLCGGALRRVYSGELYYLEEHDVETDFDIFFRTVDHFNYYKKILEESGYRKVEEIEWVTTFFSPQDQKVQLISKEYHSNGWKTINSFDMTVCQFWSDGHRLFTYTHAINDIEDRLIKPVAITNVMTVLKHIVKYGMYGYEMTPEMSRAIIAAAQGQDAVVLDIQRAAGGY